jgi:multidrug efflux system outer membrane protein
MPNNRYSAKKKTEPLMNHNIKTFPLLLAATFLASCSLAPKYAVPETESAAAFKELDAKWQTASETAGFPDGNAWWKIFQDDVLNALEDQAIAGNTDLAGALARLEQSRALYRNARGDLLPSVDAAANSTRADQGAGEYTVHSVVGFASYEADLFGRVRDTVRAARADAAATENLFAQIKLAIQADVAQTYFTLLMLDTERDVLRQTIVLREDAEKVLAARFKEGEVGEQDHLQAKSDLENTRAQLAALDESRGRTEHALAVLVGRHPSNFIFSEKKLPEILPVVPAGLPSALLERRPDVAAAERRMASANARIGVARAAMFPVLNLTVSGGYASSEIGDLFNTSSRIWALGPLAGAELVAPIFDGGSRKANVDAARAAFDVAAAEYRGSALAAFREVEDALVSLRLKSDQAGHLFEAASSAGKAARISNLRYREGESDYLEIIQTQRDELAAQRAYSQTQGQRFIATVALIRALGGGWTAELTTK